MQSAASPALNQDVQPEDVVKDSEPEMVSTGKLSNEHEIVFIDEPDNF